MREPQILTDHGGFGFHFTLDSHGWATIEIRPPNDEPAHRWHVSYLSDALGDFLRAAADVCTGRKSNVAVTWQLEPAVVHCLLQRVGEQVLACTFSVAANETAPPRTLTSFEVPPATFVAAILAGSAAIDRQAYATHWPDYRFPDEELAVLASTG